MYDLILQTYMYEGCPKIQKVIIFPIIYFAKVKHETQYIFKKIYTSMSVIQFIYIVHAYVVSFVTQVINFKDRF